MNIEESRKSLRHSAPKFRKSGPQWKSPPKKRPMIQFAGTKRNNPPPFQKKGNARPPPMRPSSKPAGRLPPSFPPKRKNSRPPPPIPTFGTE